jgi:hypothetical protein
MHVVLQAKSGLFTMNGPAACPPKKMARERAISFRCKGGLQTGVVPQRCCDWFLSAAGPSGLNLPIVLAG